VACGWGVAFFFVFGPADAVFGPIFGVAEGGSFTRDYPWMGARILCSTFLAMSAATLVSFLGPGTDPVHLRRFADRCVLPSLFWGRYRNESHTCISPEQPLRTLVSWGLLGGSILMILHGLRNAFLGDPIHGAVLIGSATLGLWILSRRLVRDSSREPAQLNQGETL